MSTDNADDRATVEVPGLSNADKESLRIWLYQHNGAQGPNPNTEGAGGLGGLWGLVQNLVAARTADLTRELAEARAERHVVHVTSEPVAEDVVWCEDCEEWVTSGASEHPCTAEAALAGLVAAMEGLADEWPCEEYEAPQTCVTAGPEVVAADGCQTCRIRAALAADHGPALAARDAGIKAEALREAADETGETCWCPIDVPAEEICDAITNDAARWLRARADRIEADQ